MDLGLLYTAGFLGTAGACGAQFALSVKDSFARAMESREAEFVSASAMKVLMVLADTVVIVLTAALWPVTVTVWAYHRLPGKRDNA